MRIRAASLLLASALSAGTLQGQEVWGSIRGRVFEDSTALGAAQVRVSSPDLLGTRTALTDGDGYYHLRALPPGTYSVHIARLGKRPVIIEGVVVELGRATSLPPTYMEASAIQLDEVRVAANRFSIDPTSTVVGATLTPEDYAALPSERDYRSLIDILPNVIQSGRGDPANANGATGLENAYFIDGMNVTNQLNALWATSLPYNFIKAVEIKTGGYEAQYGKALSAVVNAVTYSGTNDFDVNVFGFATHDAVSATPKALPTLRETNALSYDLGVRVGGPILRDRLWYSAAYNPRIWRSDREIIGLGVFPEEHLMHVFAAKASLHANAATNLELSVFGDPARHDLVEPKFPQYTPLSADPYRARFDAGNTVAALRGTVVLSRFLLEASAARSAGKENYIGGTEAAQNQPLFLDHGAKTISGGIGYWSKAALARSSFVVKGTLTLGRHTTVIGAEYEDVSTFRDLGQTGGYVLETTTSGGFRASSEGAPGTFHNRVPTMYLHNSWHVADRLTISAGVRWSAQTLTGASGVVAQKFAGEWQPRFGVIWQPSASHSDRLYASVGRFYLQEPLNISTLWYLDRSGAWSFYSTDPRQAGAVADSVWDFIPPAGAWMKLANVPGLEVENSDEISVGYERLLGASLKLTLRAVARDLRSSFQWGFDSTRWYLGTPGKGDFSILPKPVRQYRALELGAEGRWRELTYRASYVLSRNRGNYPGLYNSDQGAANPGGIWTFMTPDQAVNSTGLLPNDRTHRFKSSGSLRTGFGLTTGVFITAESGAPMNAFVVGLPPYGLPVFLEPRGSAGRTPWLWDANLRFAQELRWTGRARSRVLLDVLHVGNPQRPARLIEEKYQAQIGDAEPVLNPRYGQPLSYQPPMVARLGLEVEF